MASLRVCAHGQKSVPVCFVLFVCCLYLFIFNIDKNKKKAKKWAGDSERMRI